MSKWSVQASGIRAVGAVTFLAAAALMSPISVDAARADGLSFNGSPLGLRGSIQSGIDPGRSEAATRQAADDSRQLEGARAEREAAQREATRVNSDPNASTSQKAAAKQRLDQASENVRGLENANSRTIASQFGQDITDTANQIQTGEVVTQVSMIGGQTATSVQGQMAAQKAAMEGTQSAAMKQGASLAGSTGMVNMAVGALNRWYASQHYKQMTAHDENAAAIQRDLVNRNLSQGLEGQVNVNTYKYLEDQGVVQLSNTGFAQDEATRQARIQEIQSTARAAVSEQSVAREAAKQAMARNLITGTVAMLNGAATMAAAHQMKSAADKLQSASVGSLPTYTPGQITGAGDALGASATTITGDGTTAPAVGAASGDTAANNTDGGGLGDPYATPQPGAAPSNTPDLKMTAADPGHSGGGGVGSGMGGASTSPNTSAADGEAQPRQADNSRGAAYEGSGGGFRGGGAGPSGGMPDLSSLLAQFFPQGPDEARRPNGIMDYRVSRRRSLAGAQVDSLLDRNVNLFERVHAMYQLKQKTRDVGPLGRSGG